MPLFFRVGKNCVCSDIYSLLQFFYLCGYEGMCSYNGELGYLICRLGNGIEEVLILSQTEPQEIPFKIILKSTEEVENKDEVETIINCYPSYIFYKISGKREITEFKVNPLRKISEIYIRVFIPYLLQGLVEKLKRKNLNSYIF